MLVIDANGYGKNTDYSVILPQLYAAKNENISYISIFAFGAKSGGNLTNFIDWPPKELIDNLHLFFR